MSQGADSKRLNNPAYVYGPMVYQFPPEQGGGGGGGGGGGEKEKEKPKSNQGLHYLVLFLIIILAVGGVILYLKENGIDIRDLGWRAFGNRTIFTRTEDRYFDRQIENRFRPPGRNRGRVAVDRLYMREGPGLEYEATYLLPEFWEVSLMGETQADTNGDPWARILVDTDQGPQEGWVSQRYLDY